MSASDVDGDALTVSAVGAAQHGSVVRNTDGSYSYTPAADYFGPDSFTFTVFDGQATSVPASVSITVTEVNDPPVAGADSVSAPSGAPFGISAASLLANDTAGPANESNQVLTVTAVTRVRTRTER